MAIGNVVRVFIQGPVFQSDLRVSGLDVVPCCIVMLMVAA
jgi:hypothetical protein